MKSVSSSNKCLVFSAAAPSSVVSLKHFLAAFCLGGAGSLPTNDAGSPQVSKTEV